ncbi:DUF1819 family protein [Bombilactobacillus bombi]|uniref:DUF1819 family protein n=1 Tax=Bombilactobacillus bombi TaxID=1303590 RepID=UPI0015E605A5|nr:DUF1819 family protein [Bombilactobacillus bombi]MBA1433802.1 DUF1819 family protein [Bombilactobacillus bombi]
MKNYKSGLVSQSLWYDEFDIYLSHLNQGKTFKEINQLSDQKNIFQASSTNRALRLSRALATRIEAIPNNILNIYFQLDTSNQKIVDFLGIMLVYRILREFMYETYRDEIILGDCRLEDTEIQAFLTRKQEESSQVAQWHEVTIHRLKAAFKSLLREAGLVRDDHNRKFDVVTPVFLNPILVQAMKTADLSYELGALEG